MLSHFLSIYDKWVGYEEFLVKESLGFQVLAF